MEDTINTEQSIVTFTRPPGWRRRLETTRIDASFDDQKIAVEQLISNFPSLFSPPTEEETPQTSSYHRLSNFPTQSRPCSRENTLSQPNLPDYEIPLEEHGLTPLDDPEKHIWKILEVAATAKRHVSSAVDEPRQSPRSDSKTLKSSYTIQHLSVELLCNIFMQTGEDCLSCPRSPSSLSIGLVCRQWREIALSLGALWMSFSFTMPRSGTDVSLLPLLCLYLERSGKQPRLSFKAVLNTEDCGPLFDELASHSSRWETVTLSVPEWLFPQLPEALGDVPWLTRFNISLSEISGEGLHTVVDCGPQPALVTLTHGSLEYCAVHFSQPHVVNLVVEDSPLYSAIIYAQEFPLLDRFTFVGNADEEGVEEMIFLDRAITTLRFEQTILRQRNRSSFREFLSVLKTPTVTSFEIIFGHWKGDNKSEWVTKPIPWPASAFQAFIVESACCLQRLVMKGVHLTGAELVECLQATPKLLTLEFEEPHKFFGTEYLIHRLTIESSEETSEFPEPLIPMLTNLTLVSRLDIGDIELLDMLESRVSPQPAFLTKVQITLCGRTMHEYTKLRLSALLVDGLDVSLIEV